MSIDRTILDHPDIKHIYQKMIEYLAKGDVAEKRLVKRIVRLRLLYPDTRRYENYTEANAQKVTAILKEDDLVNDTRLATRLYESLANKKDGIRAIRRKMLARDLPAPIVDAELQTRMREEPQDLRNITIFAKEKLRAMERKFGADPVKKKQIRQKMYSWLAMRGYGSNEISVIVSKVFKK